VNVFPFLKGFHHGRVLTKRCDDAEFNLGVVGREQYMRLVTWNKGLAHLLATFGADGDVLQVGLVRGQASRGGNRLVINSMHPSRFGINLLGQGFYIGALQFVGRAPLQDISYNLMVFCQVAQHILGSRVLSCLGFFGFVHQL